MPHDIHPASRDRAPWWDLDLLLRFRETIASLDPHYDPTLLRVISRTSEAPSRLGLLAGSFNPITRAHVHLALAALRSGRCDAVWFLLSVRTVDKEAVSGALLEDRLAVMRCVVEDTDPARLGVALTNRGLYVDQAEAAVRLVPAPSDVVMIVGFDKIVQIFDPRYYDERDAALDRLFRRAAFLVAPRAGAGAAELEALLQQPENRRYGPSVTALASTGSRGDAQLSSSHVRDTVARSSRGFERDVPAAVARFVSETGAYRDSSRALDRYTLRAAVIAALATLGERGSRVDFRRLVDRLLGPDHVAAPTRETLLAASPIEAGQALAALLRNDDDPSDRDAE